MTLRQAIARVALLLPFVFLGGCFTKQGIVMPWTLERREIDTRFDSLNARIDRLEANQEELHRQTRAILGNQIAANTEQIGIVSAKIDDYGDRLNREALRPRPAADTTRPAPPADNSVALYDQAYTDYTRGRYEVAQQGFTSYLKSYPTGDRAGNAQYWLGECQYDVGQYAAARAEFEKVVSGYPDSDKGPAAMFKIGKCWEQLGDTSKAHTEYRALIQKYPRAQEAVLAAKLLK